MQTQLHLRFATQDDFKEATEWFATVPEFDPAIFSYPTCRLLAAVNGSPVAYLPSQRVLMIESLALKPGLDRLTAAKAMRDLIHGMEVVASSEQVKEVYFLATDDGIQETAKRAGFEELPWKVMRLRL